MLYIWDEYVFFFLVGFYGLWFTFVLLGIYRRFRGGMLSCRALHVGWTGYANLAGIGVGMALATPNGQEDYEILAQFLFLGAWPLAYVVIGISCLWFCDPDGVDESEMCTWGWGPDWKRHTLILLRMMLISAAITSIAWWIDGGGVGR